MQPNIRWLDDPGVFQVNRLDAHSDHPYYASEQDYVTGRNRLQQSLDGIWRFMWSKNAKTRPELFYQVDYDDSGFSEIAVPGHIELAGYDRIHYINTMYPWEGHVFRRPAYTVGNTGEGQFSQAEYNPVGSYIRRFDLDEPLRGRRVRIRFEGVEQAMYVWLNGQFIGYAEDSFTPSEFDLTGAVRPTGNILAVEVHKRSTAAYLEDQDFFRFSGIFRSVSLLAQPAVHLEDMLLRPRVDVPSRAGRIELALYLADPIPDGTVSVSVLDREKVLLRQTYPMEAEMTVSMDMPAPVALWNHQNPYLYDLVIQLYDAQGNLQELVPWQFGFRRIEIGDGIIRLNGERLIINGVNRHEWNARSGRCITDEDERSDIACFLENHINAVRTCHYPDRISWYYRCDRAGIYVMAETNLESHGSWQKAGGVEPSWNVPGSVSQWEGAVLDRARSNFAYFKNHTSVLFWSLGNESYAGEALARMNAFFKAGDPDRLVHYEGVCQNRAYTDRISDVESQMYTPPERIRAYLDSGSAKPFILCEYMHSMGNSVGGLDSYRKLLEYPMYHGGFIWDFIDQALLVKDEVTGDDVLRYGGDFDDRPSDYEFSGNGLVFADRTPKPALQEVKYYYGLCR